MHGVRQPGSTGATRGARPLSALAALALALSACAGSAPADPAGSVQQEGGTAPGGGDVQGAPLSQTGQPAAPQSAPPTPEPESEGAAALVEPIAMGQTVEASFGSTGEAHDWLFEGRAGMPVRLFTELPPGAETDPILTVLDPTGEVAATSDDVSGYNPDITLELAQGGTYTARVTTWWPGPYRLTLAAP